MNSWTLFAALWAAFETPIQDAVATGTGAIIAWILPAFRIGTIVFIMGMMLASAYAPAEDKLLWFLRTIIKAAAIYSVISAQPIYAQYVANLVTAIPTELGRAIASIAGGAPVQANAFDTIFNQAFTAGLVVFRDIGWSFKGLAIALGCVVFWACMALAIGTLFLVYLSAFLILAILVILGPIFIAAYMFPWTRRFFEGWLAGIVSGMLTQVLTVMLLSIITVASQKMISAMQLTHNPVAELAPLIMLGVLFYVAMQLGKQMYSVSVGIAGGVYHAAHDYSSKVYGAAAAAGNAAAAVATGGASAAATAASGVGSSYSSVGMGGGIQFAGRAI